MRNYLPNLLSALRIPLSLLLFACAPLSPEFFVLYALCGLSDMLDGFLARRLNCESAFGGRLDSFADFLFCVAAILRLLPEFVHRLTPLVWAGATVALVLRVVGCIAARVRRQSLAPPHSLLNRIAGFLLFLLPLLLPTRAFAPMAHFSCAVAILAAQQELFIRLYSTSDDFRLPTSASKGERPTPRSDAFGSRDRLARPQFPLMRKWRAR